MPVKLDRLRAFGPAAERADAFAKLWHRAAHDLSWRCACLVSLPSPSARELARARDCARRAMRAFARGLQATHVADALRKAMHERAGQ